MTNFHQTIEAINDSIRREVANERAFDRYNEKLRRQGIEPLTWDEWENDNIN